MTSQWIYTLCSTRVKNELSGRVRLGSGPSLPPTSPYSPTPLPPSLLIGHPYIAFHQHKLIHTNTPLILIHPILDLLPLCL